MTSSLTGQLSFTASYTHADALGGAATSLISAVATHTLIQQVLVDLPGRDSIRDFLAQDGSSYNVYESQNTTTPVTNVSSGSGITNTPSGYVLSVPIVPGFLYSQVPDPYLGKKVLGLTKRSDGKVLNPNNVWLSRNPSSSGWTSYVNIFDDDNNGGYSYTLNFGSPTVPPQFGPITDQYAVIGSPLTVPISAYDADGTYPVITSSNLPLGATLSPSVNGSSTLSWTPTTGQDGNYTITLTASEGSLSTTKTMMITVGTSKKKAWTDKYFPGITDPNIIGDTANPAGDGISNLLKYALNLDPTKAESSTGIIIGTTTVANQTYLTLTYVARTDDPTIQIQAISSNSPSAPNTSWQPQTTVFPQVDQTGVPANMARVTVQDSQPVAQSPQRFMKVLVTDEGGT